MKSEMAFVLDIGFVLLSNFLIILLGEMPVVRRKCF